MKHPRLFLFWIRLREALLRCVGVTGLCRYRGGWVVATKHKLYFLGPKNEAEELMGEEDDHDR